jgi:hypothetical protein
MCGAFVLVAVGPAKRVAPDLRRDSERRGGSSDATRRTLHGRPNRFAPRLASLGILPVAYSPAGPSSLGQQHGEALGALKGLRLRSEFTGIGCHGRPRQVVRH